MPFRRAAFVVLAACGALLAAAPRAAWSAEASQTIAVGAFHKLRVDGNAEVTLRAGEAESVTVRGSENQSQDVRVDVQVRNGELHIRTRAQSSWWSDVLEPAHSFPRITVTFRSLDAVELSGTVRLRADALRTPRLDLRAAGAVSINVKELRADELVLHGSGAVKAQLAGKVARQQIVMAGAAKYEAPELASDDAEVDVSGAGRVIVHADRTLRVSIAGAGAVDYVGEPRITRDITGAGRLRPYRSSALHTPRSAPAVIAGVRGRESRPA